MRLLLSVCVLNEAASRPVLVNPRTLTYNAMEQSTSCGTYNLSNRNFGNYNKKKKKEKSKVG